MVVLHNLCKVLSGYCDGPAIVAKDYTIVAFWQQDILAGKANPEQSTICLVSCSVSESVACPNHFLRCDIV